MRGIRDGDHFMISGEKTWISNGDYSDFMICTVRTGDRSLSHVLVDRYEHGYEPRNIDKMGLNSYSTAQIHVPMPRFQPQTSSARRAKGSRIRSGYSSAHGCTSVSLRWGLMRASLEATIRPVHARPATVRQAHRCASACRCEDCGDGHVDGRGASPMFSSAVVDRCRSAVRRRGLDGQVVFHGDGDRGVPFCRAASWWQWDHPRLPGRTLPPQCDHSADPGRNDGDPEVDHCSGDDRSFCVQLMQSSYG